MTVADDLIAVRTLLILHGRTTVLWRHKDGRLCLRRAMMDVRTTGFSTIIPSYTDDYDAYVELRYAAHIEMIARDRAMYDALVPHLPIELRQLENKYPYSQEGHDIVMHFNEECSSDQDVFDLIDKALADLGAI